MLLRLPAGPRNLNQKTNRKPIGIWLARFKFHLLLSFHGGRHADWIREVDWRTEIRGNEPVRTRADHRFRPCLEPGTRTDGALAAGVGGLQRHRRGHYPGKEAAEARFPRSHLLGRTCGGASPGLSEVGRDSS